MDHTQSATELSAVLIEPIGAGANVWLRKNITTVEVELDDGLSQTMWEADEVSGTLSWIPTTAEAEEHFDELWDEFEGENTSDHDLLRTLAERVATGELTLVDLAAVIDDLLAGVVELADMVVGTEE